MPAQIVSPYFAPDIDTSWAVSPGALSSMNGFAPMQDSNYGSIGTANLFGSSTLTGTDLLSAKMFRQVNDTVRLLVFRPGNIDEYNASASRTNRGTGYSSSTERWSSASWGDQIIATNGIDAVQTSSGAGFSTLTGEDINPPKAKFIAANLGFVILGAVNDGGSNNYPDGVWWSGLRNPLAWEPSLITQAGWSRLLEVPGPLTGLVAYRGGFCAFKHGAAWFGQYVGSGQADFFFWNPISLKVGCVAPESIAECDGRLFWLSASGFHSYDGQTLQSIGLPVFQSFFAESNFVERAGSMVRPTATAFEGVSKVQAAADDIEGIVWFKSAYQTTVHILGEAIVTQWAVLYGYNVRTGKWGRHAVATGSRVDTAYPHMVSASYSDMQTFKADATGRFLMLWNDNAGSTLRSVRYPVATTDSAVAAYGTGVFGSVDGSSTIDKHHIRLLKGTEAGALGSCLVAGYTTEDRLITNGSASASINTEYNEADVRFDARFRSVLMTFTEGKTAILGGVGFSDVGSGGRR